MAGTLVSSTLSDGTNSTSTTNAIQGSAKAWGYFKFVSGGQSVTKNASYNISSFTRNGLGDYTVNLTNAMPSANYGITVGYNYSTGPDSIVGQIMSTTQAAGSLNIRTGYVISGGGITAYDYGFTIAVFA